MARKLRFGVLGVAGIAVKKVIPAMQQCELCEITGIASRDIAKARKAAQRLDIPRAYGSYEELIADPEIDAIYNPLPNHLHIPLSVKAAEAGKHVLCEKPIALHSSEVQQLIAARDRNRVKVSEAFMVRTHPQWLRARAIAHSGKIGSLRAFMGVFSYFNNDPGNIRNVPAYGGGGLMDIGCYPIFTSRFIFGEEPKRAIGLVEYDPEMKTDRLASAILDYPSGQAVFTCSTQLTGYQKIQILGTKGRVELEIPFNAPPDRPTRIFVDDGHVREEEFSICDQYTIQGDEFARAVFENKEVAVPLESSIRNMTIIEAIVRSAQSGHWEKAE